MIIFHCEEVFTMSINKKELTNEQIRGNLRLIQGTYYG